MILIDRTYSSEDVPDLERAVTEAIEGTPVNADGFHPGSFRVYLEHVEEGGSKDTNRHMFHKCPTGNIRPYPSLLCSSHSEPVEDFDPVVRIKELEEENARMDKALHKILKGIHPKYSDVQNAADGGNHSDTYYMAWGSVESVMQRIAKEGLGTLHLCKSLPESCLHCHEFVETPGDDTLCGLGAWGPTGEWPEYLETSRHKDCPLKALET